MHETTFLDYHLKLYKDAIEEIVTLLDLTSCQVIRQNYGELMTAKFRELQPPLTSIQATFTKEKEWLQK